MPSIAVTVPSVKYAFRPIFMMPRESELPLYNIIIELLLKLSRSIVNLSILSVGWIALVKRKARATSGSRQHQNYQRNTLES
ncbi:hypothetical protein N7509_005927 [Penicillium cosmopolitanum]|uniref:Uncharacterized protein n=1 Tax=Penicillium cosmopolitanum TaxID=1131564 RepID=A0A9W9W330_9EURO|nr:uncharacterized protein N7509_005927 [Penicillium cosmopolitanum]KAJ5397814.1 hypothetical protein N7509_005927 [Penicillium cosmopolitanum]